MAQATFCKQSQPVAHISKHSGAMKLKWSLTLAALMIPAGAKQLRAVGRSGPVDFSNEQTTPCMEDEHGQQFDRQHASCTIESNSRNMVRQWLSPNATVLEVGARYGSVACVIAAMQHQSGKVVAVEPDPVVWAALDKNLQTHSCNVKVLKGVVGTTPVTIEKMGYGTRTHNCTNCGAVQTIPAYPLAQVEQTFGMHFDTFVVDCEGCFPTLLHQNPQLVQQAKLIIVEAHTDRPEDGEVQSVQQLVQNGGFQLVAQFSRQRVLRRVHP
mmetsp:Transcript_101132/g.184592  ORF Transcript_101132/g.184592 Transcript_101132/m.184592 type:complete len:269 (+) Transcript_101132:2-808(+)